MNIHLMIIMLTFTQPTFTAEPLEVIPAPQIVAPLDLWEDRISLKEMLRLKKVRQVINQQVWAKDIYKGKDKRWHVTWSELA